jgi:predicted RNase H-like nuclease (RuvC/YqgF family)
MAKLYELTDDYLSLWESLSDPEADWTEAEEKLRGIERAFDDKVSACAKMIRNMESEETALTREIDRMSQRHDALVRKTKAIKAYVQAEMETSGREKVRTDVFTVSVQHSPDKVHVVDETKIPPQYYQTTKRLDKIEVLRMLKAGYAVPGCELTQGSHLRIR